MPNIIYYCLKSIRPGDTVSNSDTRVIVGDFHRDTTSGVIGNPEKWQQTVTSYYDPTPKPGLPFGELVNSIGYGFAGGIAAPVPPDQDNQRAPALTINTQVNTVSEVCGTNVTTTLATVFGGGSFLETSSGANHRKALKVKVASPALPTGLSYSFVNNGPVTSGPDLLNSTTVKITGTAELGQEVLGDTYSVQVEDATGRLATITFVLNLDPGVRPLAVEVKIPTVTTVQNTAITAQTPVLGTGGEPALV